MKAKSSYSAMVDYTVAKGTLGFFAVITVFIASFVAWSAAGLVSALVQFCRKLMI